MSLSLAASALLEPAVRVMVVDDVLLVRGLVAQWLAAEPDFQIVGSYRNGREAVANIAKADPDVVVLDIDMPELDGLAALPLLLAYKPDAAVIMASTLTRRNAEASLKALKLGAADYVPKPGNGRELMAAPDFRRELVEKIRGLGRARQRRAAGRHVVSVPTPDITLRPFSPAMPRALVIGSSTGGPEALQAVMGRLGRAADRVPILVAQHMPATFTTVLAEHIGRACGRPSREGLHGEPIEPGQVYVAPGGKHMRVEPVAERPTIALDDGPPVHFCKPAVDPLFASASAVYGAGTLALVLTGMGSDGARGALAVAKAGGNVIAQDEATSVVWGMPGATARSGACAAVLPLDAIAAKIVQLVGGRP
ncbi:MAG TPA: chemotaxis response regulator protein-glutamate methylesterase [Xanthobacteraceae bacterium]|nr:chemotaxis response regulator protein-glutamate methylesterase [Xanthobacteraceae bacterium]